MQSVPIGSKIELRVPADNAMMLIIRLATSGVAARSGMTMVNLDDFKIAVEEAASYLLFGKRRPEAVYICYEIEEDDVLVTLTGEGESDLPASESSETEEEVIRAILSSMVDEVNVTEDGQRRVALRKRCR